MSPLKEQIALMLSCYFPPQLDSFETAREMLKNNAINLWIPV